MLLKIGVLIFLMLVSNISIAARDDVAIEYRLLYLTAYDSAPTPETVLLGITDFNGTEIIYADTPLRSHRFYISRFVSITRDLIYVSPNRRYVSAASENRRLVIIDVYDGTTWEPDFNPEGYTWVTWGWKDDARLVIARLEDSGVVFYELNVLNEPTTLVEVESINDFYIWNNQFKPEDIVESTIPDAFIFSPDFRYVITPPYIFASDTESYMETTIFWDLETKSAQALITGVPWWHGAPLPAWSPSGDAVVYWMLNGNGSYLFVYRTRTTPELIAPLPCDYCVFNHLTWNPDGSRIAYWQESYGFHLYTVSVESGETIELAAEISGPTPLFWSPNGRWIAYKGDENTVIIVNALTGELCLTYPVDNLLKLIGWIAPSS